MDKARDIYLTIVAKGWDAAQALFNPGMLVRKDDPTLGEFFAEVQAKAGLSAKTFRNYASAFRTIASASASNLTDDKSKYDYRGGGQQQWLSRVDAIKLAAMTPDRVQQWKIAHIKNAGASLSAQVTARRTVNSYIRCARSLFSRSVLKFVKVRLPATLPFEGIELEKNVGDNRALRMSDYKLVSAREDHDAWELFNLATDRSEQHNLAAEQPDRVRDMAARWQQLQDSFIRDAGVAVTNTTKKAQP